MNILNKHFLNAEKTRDGRTRAVKQARFSNRYFNVLTNLPPPRTCARCHPGRSRAAGVSSPWRPGTWSRGSRVSGSAADGPPCPRLSQEEEEGEEPSIVTTILRVNPRVAAALHALLLTTTTIIILSMHPWLPLERALSGCLMARWRCFQRLTTNTASVYHNIQCAILHAFTILPKEIQKYQKNISKSTHYAEWNQSVFYYYYYHISN